MIYHQIVMSVMFSSTY